MGTRWGINRTAAQIHALLYISPRPLSAEEIASTLSVARSNVSTSLRELQSWGIVKVIHVFGDRRDHFESLKDVWAMFQLILDERKRREMDPTIEVLRACLAELEGAKTGDGLTRHRLAELLEFFESMASAYEEMRSTPAADIRALVKLRGRTRKLLKLILAR
jgi:DNA-binding transcriptional regulator GbsR (MarR family)